MSLTAQERQELAANLGLVFKPATPINRDDLFSGRKQQTRDVIDAVNQDGQHVILYGERGVGKTSLANIIMFRARSPSPILAPHVNCTSVDDFPAIWRKVFQECIGLVSKNKVDVPKRLLNELKRYADDARDITPDLAKKIMEQLGSLAITVVILDEFDTVTDSTTRHAIANTIKLFSDRAVPATIIIIGVADDVSGLLSEHQSVERCLVQVKMPRMSRDELEQIVTHCLKVVGMEIEREALHEISRISKGLPHYAHLLGLYAGRQAADEGSRKIKQAHVTSAVKSATEKAQDSILGEYHRATSSAKQNALHKPILLGCALAETDELGYFSPAGVREPIARILGRKYKIESFSRRLHEFCEPDRGSVLKKFDSPNRPRFRFSNPLMEPYVIMRGFADNLITDEDLRATRDQNDPQGRLF